MGSKRGQDVDKPKRGQGEGAVYWDEARQRYRAAITLDGGKRKYFSGRTERDVKRLLNAALVAKEKGLLQTGPRQTVEKYMTAWLVGIKSNLKIRAWERYRIDVEKRIIPQLGKRALDSLTPSDLRTFYAKLLTDDGLAPRSVRNVHRVLHKALQDAVNDDVLCRNVADRVEPPRADDPDRRWLVPDEARQFLIAAKGEPLEALYILAITTGMRQAEILGLRWDVVDLEHGVLAVLRTVYSTQTQGIVWGDTKNTRSRRSIALPPLVVDALRRHKERQALVRAAAGKRWQEQNLVFTTSVGGPICRHNFLQRHFHPFLERAKLPRIRFHDLRHSAASLLGSLSTSPKVVQELLGHSSIQVTMDLYSHVLPASHGEAVTRLADLLTQKPENDDKEDKDKPDGDAQSRPT